MNDSSVEPVPEPPVPLSPERLAVLVASASAALDARVRVLSVVEAGDGTPRRGDDPRPIFQSNRNPLAARRGIGRSSRAVPRDQPKDLP